MSVSHCNNVEGMLETAAGAGVIRRYIIVSRVTTA